jgi:hypothetical protein
MGAAEGIPVVNTPTRGTVLAGRYRLDERVQNTADGSLWRALDSTLDRKVSIRLMRPGHPFAADVADAARRAALIDDSRLVRVLDVGSDGDTAFVVSEHVEGDNLATLVERSPLAPPVVRRIIGEVAQGLAGAAGRGLHHLRLTPRSVIVCYDGTVKVVGTAVEAAAAGLEPAHAATANRVDAVGLVGLLYSGLTGRWPMGDAGFPPAPRTEGGGPVPAADLVPGVPNDLDTLCVVTLGAADDGPRSPTELVRQLAPWPSAAEAPLRAAARRAPAEGALPPNPALTLRGRPTTPPRGTPERRGGDLFNPSRSANPVGPANPARPVNPVRPVSPAAAAPPPAAAAGPGEDSKPPRRSAALFPTPSVAATGALRIPKEPRIDRPKRMDTLFGPDKVAAEPAGPPAPAPPVPPKIQPPVGRAGGSQPAQPASPRPTAPPNAVKSPTGNGSFGNGPYDRSQGQGRDSFLPWNPGWTDTPARESLEATGPFPILIPPEAPPREQSRLVIISVVVVLILGLVLAAFSLRSFGGGGSSASPSISPLPAATQPAAQPTTAAPTPSPSASASVAVDGPPVEVASVRAIDPQGDGNESSGTSDRAIDGDSSTYWRSDSYQSAEFGGLKKGIGLALKLKTTSAVQSATIAVIGTGGAVQLRTSDSSDLASSTIVGKASFQDGKATIRVSDAKQSKYVILWFTELPSVGGKYRAEVSEVRLK